MQDTTLQTPIPSRAQKEANIKTRIFESKYPDKNMPDNQAMRHAERNIVTVWDLQYHASRSLHAPVPELKLLQLLRW